MLKTPQKHSTFALTDEDKRRIAQIKAQHDLPSDVAVLRFLLHQEEAPSTALMPLDNTICFQATATTRANVAYLRKHLHMPSDDKTIRQVLKTIARAARGEMTPDQLFSALQSASMNIDS